MEASSVNDVAISPPQGHTHDLRPVVATEAIVVTWMRAVESIPVKPGAPALRAAYAILEHAPDAVRFGDDDSPLRSLLEHASPAVRELTLGFREAHRAMRDDPDFTEQSRASGPYTRPEPPLVRSRPLSSHVQQRYPGIRSCRSGRNAQGAA